MRKHILSSVLIIALLTIIGPSFGTTQAAPLAAYPAPGDLDTTFAGFGTAGIVNETALERAKGMAVQPDGKIVVVGYAATSFDRLLRNAATDRFERALREVAEG